MQNALGANGFFSPLIGLSVVRIPEVFAKVNSAQFPFFFLKLRINFWFLPLKIPVGKSNSVREALDNMACDWKAMQFFFFFVNLVPRFPAAKGKGDLPFQRKTE